ncbi:MAG: ferredoxin [Ardenticatenales bacterium]|nr:ferredoxin [Ardenticatenales bacterium]
MNDLVDPIEKPHALNVDGPFYSVDQGCAFCGAPHVAAPDLMGWEEKEEYSYPIHCFFKRQPETPEEIEQAIQAMDWSCVQNLRYRGTTPDILEKLCNMGYRHLCDALVEE